MVKLREVGIDPELPQFEAKYDIVTKRVVWSAANDATAEQEDGRKWLVYGMMASGRCPLRIVLEARPCVSSSLLEIETVARCRGLKHVVSGNSRTPVPGSPSLRTFLLHSSRWLHPAIAIIP